MKNQGDTGADWSFYSVASTRIEPFSRVINLGSGHHFKFEIGLRKSHPHVEILSVDLGTPETVPDGCEYLPANIEGNLPLIVGSKKFDVACLFEVLEHIDKTDVCLQNVREILSDDGRVLISIPNLSSIYARIELLLGFQPHVLEVSNEVGPLGMGPFGRLNYGEKTTPLHHIRGITLRGLIGLLEHNGLRVRHVWGFNPGIPLWPRKHLQKLASSVLVEAVLA